MAYNNFNYENTRKIAQEYKRVNTRKHKNGEIQEKMVKISFARSPTTTTYTSLGPRETRLAVKKHYNLLKQERLEICYQDQQL